MFIRLSLASCTAADRKRFDMQRVISISLGRRHRCDKTVVKMRRLGVGGATGGAWLEK